MKHESAAMTPLINTIEREETLSMPNIFVKATTKTFIEDRYLLVKTYQMRVSNIVKHAVK